MKECPKHPENLAMELWQFCPLCGRPLVESLAGIPVIIPNYNVSAETLHEKMQEETDRINAIIIPKE